ncbi:hypothetical protein TNCV_3915991 [Trichonephila clavipes]|nr:hypothetical protein TNCV_3915991 [Trichonephila clavipes]
MRFHSTNGKLKRDHLAEGTVSPESLVITPIFELWEPTVVGQYNLIFLCVPICRITVYCFHTEAPSPEAALWWAVDLHTPLLLRPDRSPLSFTVSTAIFCPGLSDLAKLFSCFSTALLFRWTEPPHLSLI